ncbi:polyhydroxyalkanoate synthesis regulator [Anaerobacillus arseniciselenatis]|uniref:Polyhydroxyalkanoate synthesis regulator n=1 Tax=Anaerobacillus arseniciselenatis TaxID=85682 RepID=A0A1S2LAV9_9BACI|nr:polyhydroxyalkanoate synthesis regulator [Anaerobacillus arseniciselenatis]OIJ08705.1 polyhydroxyalkanoate synthesis regulator [Anaerobacillus arseniciselenatis]
MKNIMGKGIALGLGLVVKSKEQMEALVDELVKKGEIKKEESNEVLNELLQKGEETKSELDQMIKERMNIMLNELNLATKEDIQRIERRLDALEQQPKLE